MAKKKEKLSMEELLEQAIIKEGDIPYAIPENWVWTKLDSISEIITGGTPSKSKTEYYGGKFPFIKPTDLEQGRHVTYASEYLSEEGKKASRIIPSGTTSVCCIGTIGKCGYLEVEATTNQQINSIIPNNINNLFVYYYCCSECFVNSLIALSSATTISIINKSKMSTIAIPIPPILEQQRIVDIVDRLFEKLDTAKKLVQNALDSVENSKNAILHKAFTGELTAKWREENGVSLDKWEEKKLGDFISYSKEKYNPTIEEKKAIYIGLEHIEKNGRIIDKGNSEEVKSLKTVFKSGDILYGKLRPYLNKHDIADFDGICSTDILVMRAKKTILNKYINYMLNSSNFIDYAIANSKGINLPRISEKEISKYKLRTPSLNEQQEIVRILDNLLYNEQRAKELCDATEKIDLMKKAILSRVFCGELGTNDPDEESAFELLKEVLKEKI